MNTKKYRAKRQTIQKEQRLKKKHYLMILGLMIIGSVYHYFIQPATIGYDIRYPVVVFWVPTIAGILILGFYRRHFLINRFAANKAVVLWAFMTFFYLVQGFVVSYLSVGLLAKVGWDLCNYQIARQNPEALVSCRITGFQTKRRPYAVDFKLNDRQERFKVSYRKLKAYKDEPAENFLVRIKIQKGIWGYYLVNEWTIVRK